MIFNQNKTGKLKWIRSYEKGSFTVELSLLFPIILFVIVTILVFALYVNDLVCVRAFVNRYVLTANELNKADDEIVKELQEELENKILVVSIKNLEAEQQKNKTKISVDVNFKFGILNIDRQDVVTVTVPAQDIPFFVVKAKVLIDTAEKLKGVE